MQNMFISNFYVGEYIDIRLGGYSEGTSVAYIRYTNHDKPLYLHLMSNTKHQYQFVYGTFLKDAYLEGPDRGNKIICYTCNTLFRGRYRPVFIPITGAQIRSQQKGPN